MSNIVWSSGTIVINGSIIDRVYKKIDSGLRVMGLEPLIDWATFDSLKVNDDRFLKVKWSKVNGLQVFVKEGKSDLHEADVTLYYSTEIKYPQEEGTHGLHAVTEPIHLLNVQLHIDINNEFVSFNQPTTLRRLDRRLYEVISGMILTIVQDDHDALESYVTMAIPESHHHEGVRLAVIEMINHCVATEISELNLPGQSDSVRFNLSGGNIVQQTVDWRETYFTDRSSLISKHAEAIREYEKELRDMRQAVLDNNEELTELRFIKSEFEAHSLNEVKILDAELRAELDKAKAMIESQALLTKTYREDRDRLKAECKEKQDRIDELVSQVHGSMKPSGDNSNDTKSAG